MRPASRTSRSPFGSASPIRPRRRPFAGSWAALTARLELVPRCRLLGRAWLLASSYANDCLDHRASPITTASFGQGRLGHACLSGLSKASNQPASGLLTARFTRVVRIGLTFVVPTANCRGFFNRPGGAGSRHRARTPSRSRRASSAALVEAGASEQTAETAAGDIGELASEVRIIRWMLAMLLAVVISGFGLLGAATLQILPLLP